MTDIGQRLRATWARRGEAGAALRSSAVAVGPRLHGLWLKRRGWPNAPQASASSSRSPLVRRVFATRTMGVTGIVVGIMAVAAILALVIGAPVPFLANSIAKRFQAETGYQMQVTG